MTQFFDETVAKTEALKAHLSKSLDIDLKRESFQASLASLVNRTPAQIIGDDALTQLIFEGYAVVPDRPLPPPFAFLRIHPDDGVTVVPDASYKPGSVVFPVYSEEMVNTLLGKIT